jgi:REP element-mobilizing transposase RayT
MSRNYYSEINLHIVWHAKDSLPLLKPEIEPLAHRELRQKIINTDGVFVHEIGGTETHVHLAVTIQPTVHISELIGQLKGASSHDVNQKPRQPGMNAGPKTACGGKGRERPSCAQDLVGFDRQDR